MLDYKYVFFDLDGTLSDSAPGIIDSVLYSLEKMGVSEPDRASLTKFVGPPLMESFSKYYGFDGGAQDLAIEHFREYYREKGIYGNTMYAGIPEMLDAVASAGKRLAVATSKPEVFARQILERYGIADRFDFIAGSVFDKSRIQKQEVISYAMDNLGIRDPKSVLMVGDRAHDVVGAAACGVDCMGVLFGYGSKKELEDAGAAYIAATVQDITKIIAC